MMKLEAMEAKVLRAGFDDLEAILELQKDCYLSEAEIYNDYTIPALNQDLASLQKEYKHTTILKCLVNDEIAGSVRAYAENDTVYIGRLIVGKDHQNKGYGSLLMRSIELEFGDYRRFELFTGHKSLKNLYLYNKLGYREFRRERKNDNLTMVFLEKKI